MRTSNLFSLIRYHIGTRPLFTCIHLHLPHAANIDAMQFADPAAASNRAPYFLGRCRTGNVEKDERERAPTLPLSLSLAPSLVDLTPFLTQGRFPPQPAVIRQKAVGEGKKCAYSKCVSQFILISNERFLHFTLKEHHSHGLGVTARTELGQKAGPWISGLFSCYCLPLLPGFACSIYLPLGSPFIRAL